MIEFLIGLVCFIGFLTIGAAVEKFLTLRSQGKAQKSFNMDVKHRHIHPTVARQHGRKLSKRGN